MTTINKKEYEDIRIIIYSVSILIIGFLIGYFIPTSKTKIENSAMIQNFNKAHNNMLDSDIYRELSDENKVEFIEGYKRGSEDQIDYYNKQKDVYLNGIIKNDYESSRRVYLKFKPESFK